MARRRFYRAESKKQQAILKAASKEFAAYGYEAASVNRVIEAAGLSKGAFYYYFDDKADLAATTLSACLDEMIAPFGDFELPPAGADFWAEMTRLQKLALETLRKSPEQIELVSKLGAAWARDADLASHLQPLIQKWLDLTAKLWRHGQQQGAVRDDLPAETLIAVLTAVKQTLVRLCIKPDAVPDSAQLAWLSEVQMDFFRRMAEPRPKKAAGAA